MCYAWVPFVTNNRPAEADRPPDGWGLADIASLAQVNPEQLASGTDPDYLLEYLDIGAIEQPGIIGAGRTVRFADAPSRARRIVRKGDILVATVRPYLRNFARVREAPDNLVASTGYAVIRPGDGVDGRYLYQHVLSSGFVEYLKTRMIGSNYPAVTAHDVRSYRLSVPPLSEQRKIAAILSSVDDAVEKTQAVIGQAQLVKRGVMEESFTRNGWRTLPLIDACVARGQYGANVAKRDFEPGGIRYIRITDIDEDGALKDAAVGIDAAAADGYLLQTGDVLIARSGSVGKSYLHGTTGTRHAFAGYLIRFRTDPKILLPQFLREYLDTRTYWRWVADRRRVTAQPNINATEYGQLAVPCPPLGEQRRIIRIAAGFSVAIQSAKADLHGRQRLKQALLSVLLTGKLRVTPDSLSRVGTRRSCGTPRRSGPVPSHGTRPPGR